MKNSKILRIAAPLFAACFAVLSCGVAGCTQGSDNPPSEEKDYADVFIFMGQSNMAGRGDASEAIPCGEGHAYEFRAVSGNDEDGWLYPLAEPFGAMENNQALSDGNNGDGKKSGGMTSAFCEAYYQSTGVKVIGVSASVGGTAMSSWLPGTDYFEEAKRRLDACIEYAEGEGGMSVRHINMVWCQGESDAGNQQYTEQLKSILEGLRSSFVECCLIITPSEYDSPYATVLADSQIALCEEDDDILYTNGKDGKRASLKAGEQKQLYFVSEVLDSAPFSIRIDSCDALENNEETTLTISDITITEGDNAPAGSNDPHRSELADLDEYTIQMASNAEIVLDRGAWYYSCDGTPGTDYTFAETPKYDNGTVTFAFTNMNNIATKPNHQLRYQPDYAVGTWYKFTAKVTLSAAGSIAYGSEYDGVKNYPTAEFAAGETKTIEYIEKVNDEKPFNITVAPADPTQPITCTVTDIQVTEAEDPGYYGLAMKSNADIVAAPGIWAYTASGADNLASIPVLTTDGSVIMNIASLSKSTAENPVTFQLRYQPDFAVGTQYTVKFTFRIDSADETAYITFSNDYKTSLDFAGVVDNGDGTFTVTYTDTVDAVSPFLIQINTKSTETPVAIKLTVSDISFTAAEPVEPEDGSYELVLRNNADTKANPSEWAYWTDNGAVLENVPRYEDGSITFAVSEMPAGSNCILRYQPDLEEGNGNADSAKGAKHSQDGWNYDEEVAFPFGYGLSYTNFTYSQFDVERDGSNYLVSVNVKNDGAVSGKEVVQVYLQKPYTDYDKEMGIEKSAIELAGYAKTTLLAPGDDETVTVTVPEEYFKTYDANGEQTYIIEEGTYYLTVASDAHVAVNNILASEGKDVSQAVMGGSGNTKPVFFGADFVWSEELEEDFWTYSRSTQTGEDIYNRFDSADINKYENRGSNSVTWLSRSYWDKTYPETAATLTLNAEMASGLDYDKEPADEGYDMPEYGVFASGSSGTPDTENGDLVAYQFMNAPLYPENAEDPDEVYNEDDGLTYRDWEERWNQLLDQMTLEEQAYMVVNSYHWIQGAESIALPASRQENGPVGITKREEAFFSLPNDETIRNGTGWIWVSYPCAGIIAASFNNEVAQNIGEYKSEDMLYLGYNGIYGPGVNLHRSPYGGRAFEYPSEDPFLAGMIEAYECKGIESKGCLAYAKHFALNDMETNRVNCGIWANEQTVREIYLRAFEIVFTEGKASATMNAYTRMGTTWSGASYEMMTEVLRGEWGWDGLVISDWDTTGSAMSKLDGVLAGTDTFDGNNDASVLTQYSDNAAVAQAIRQAAKRVIYNVVRTNAMNGMTISSVTIKMTPWWQTVLLALECTFASLTAVSAGMLVASVVINLRSKRNATVLVTDDDEQLPPE